MTLPASATPGEGPRARSAPRLLADIGGTYARFALQISGQPARRIRLYRCVDFPDLVSAIRRYYRDARVTPQPRVAALAIAAPIVGDRVRMTNHPWTFTGTSVRRALSLDTLIIVNDFVAIAESIPFLTARDRRQIGGAKRAARAPIAVVGAGTGLGVGALVPCGEDAAGVAHWQAIATEGGHATVAANDAREAAVLARIGKWYRHVSIERCLSGQGLVNLYRALAEIDGATVPDLPPATITQRARRGDPLAREAVSLFCAMLGSTAGDLALTFGARGGIYIAGGIVPKLGGLFDTALFRRRFLAKGRYRGYLLPIPCFVIQHPLPALAGLAALLDRPMAKPPRRSTARARPREQKSGADQR